MSKTLTEREANSLAHDLVRAGNVAGITTKELKATVGRIVGPPGSEQRRLFNVWLILADYAMEEHEKLSLADYQYGEEVAS